MEYIDVFIHPDGSVQMEVKGVRGKKCLDLTKNLEQALGEVRERKLTKEYYQASKQHITIKK
jgi:hypothetical protein